MEAIISAQAGKAIILDDDRFISITLSSTFDRVECSESELCWLLSTATDFKLVDAPDEAEIIQQLELSWTQDRALQLILIFLDNDEDIEIRVSAAECLEEFLAIEQVKMFVAHRLYSKPFENAIAIESISKTYNSSLSQYLFPFLSELSRNQKEIFDQWNAWENLPLELFDNEADKAQLRIKALKLGIFYVFVTEKDKKNSALIKTLTHPAFAGDRKAQKVFRRWASEFDDDATSRHFAPSEEYMERPIKPSNERYFKKTIKGYKAFEQVKSQKDAIKELLHEGKLDVAMTYTKQLIRSQRRHSTSEQIAKSLCDLAQFAKNIGSPYLQKVFAEMAISEAPSDTFSYAVFGDALRSLGEFQEAQEAYLKVGAFGDERMGLLGRGLIFKDLGQESLAFEILDQCVERFPNDLVARTATASALADFGHLNDALVRYDEIIASDIASYPVVPINGRANVLRYLGRYNEAVEALRVLVDDFPEDSVAHHALGETLRDSGKLTDSLKLFEKLILKFPFSPSMRTSYAKVLRDLGEYSESIKQFRAAVDQFPFDPFAITGLADTYRKLGNIEEASSLYDEIFTKFNRHFGARVGKACTLSIQNNYKEALKLLPVELPATFSQWTAYHVKGMTLLRAGRITEAEKILHHGITENPWIQQRQYFSAALASLKIYQQRYEESLALVSDVIHPAVLPTAQIIEFHALSQLGNQNRADLIYNDIISAPRANITYLKDYKSARDEGRNNAALEKAMFYAECNMLLQVA